MMKWVEGFLFKYALYVCRSMDCSIMCMKTLLKVLDYSVVYKKVFSEVGLLEVLITCLHRFAAAVKEREALQGVVFPHFLFVFDISDTKISHSLDKEM